jgi:hypothetical protein
MAACSNGGVRRPIPLIKLQSLVEAMTAASSLLVAHTPLVREAPHASCWLAQAWVARLPGASASTPLLSLPICRDT